MGGNVFQCRHKGAIATQYDKTIEAFAAYISKEMSMGAQDLKPLWDKKKTPVIPEPDEWKEPEDAADKSIKKKAIHLRRGFIDYLRKFWKLQRSPI